MFLPVVPSQAELDLDAIDNTHYALVDSVTGIVTNIIQIKHISQLPELPDASTLPELPSSPTTGDDAAIAAYNAKVDEMNAARATYNEAFRLAMKYRYTPPEGQIMVWCEEQLGTIQIGVTTYANGEFTTATE
jgi:hypothetical protein